VLTWRRSGMQTHQANRFIAMFAVAQARAQRAQRAHPARRPALPGHTVSHAAAVGRHLSSDGATCSAILPLSQPSTVRPCIGMHWCKRPVQPWQLTLSMWSRVRATTWARAQGQEVDRAIVGQCTVALTPQHNALISPRWPAALQLLAAERAAAAKPAVGPARGLGLAQPCRLRLAQSAWRVCQSAAVLAGARVCWA